MKAFPFNVPSAYAKIPQLKVSTSVSTQTAIHCSTSWTLNRANVKLKLVSFTPPNERSNCNCWIRTCPLFVGQEAAACSWRVVRRLGLLSSQRRTRVLKASIWQLLVWMRDEYSLFGGRSTAASCELRFGRLALCHLKVIVRLQRVQWRIQSRLRSLHGRYWRTRASQNLPSPHLLLFSAVVIACGATNLHRRQGGEWLQSCFACKLHSSFAMPMVSYRPCEPHNRCRLPQTLYHGNVSLVYHWRMHLQGRAKVEMSLTLVDRPSGNINVLIPMVVDGYNAPVTGGNFLDLVMRGFYDGMDI